MYIFCNLQEIIMYLQEIWGKTIHLQRQNLTLLDYEIFFMKSLENVI